MNAKIYKCFIASPSDTHAERAACDAVFSEINSTLGESFKFRVESVKWENDAIPAFGEDGQHVLNKQLQPSEHDFFIGIMWCRFGTPTPRSGSGTEEEFDQAYNRWKLDKTARIQMYFNTKPPHSINDIDPLQLGKVKSFKQKISDCGGLYCDFDTLDNFKTILRKSIEKELLKQPQLADALNVEDKLNKRLASSLMLFSDQPVTWINRILCKTGHMPSLLDAAKSHFVSVEDVIPDAASCVITAPPQFGLTCLSHYMIREAWLRHGKAWAYLDFDETGPRDLAQRLAAAATFFGSPRVDCVVVDSWSTDKAGCQKLLELLHSEYPDSRLIIMRTASESVNEFLSKNIQANRSFTAYNLIALPRSEVRKAVRAYSVRLVGDENAVLEKLILDFEALNIHRTPMNCWTLLKVSESHAERSIINRTQMLDKVLFLLFSMAKPPTYGTLPDGMDCEHVLGYFCEGLIRASQLTFTKEHFIEVIRTYCADKLVDLDVDVVYDILVDNRIVVPATQRDLRFRASFWVYYFAAKRMHNDETFRLFILGEQRYARYPELIEFYTGIDRNRNDILRILSDELSSTRKVLDGKLGFDGVLNPLKQITWRPSPDAVGQMTAKLSSDVLNSNVPDELKDQHADKNYDQLKPYNQDLRSFLRETSFLLYTHQLESASKALRNSDYADVEVRKELLKEVVGGWTEISKVIFLLAPVLSQTGAARFEGVGFHLTDDFDGLRSDPRRLFLSVLKLVPFNVIRLVKDSISSDRIGPLFFDYLKSSPNGLARHLVVSFLVTERPKGWKAFSEEYISSLDKNSFYLLDIYTSIQEAYRFQYLTPHDERQMGYLMKKCLAKHELSIPNPVGKVVARIPDTALPKRECVDEAP